MISGAKWDRSNIGDRLEDAIVYRKDKARAYKEGESEFVSMAIPLYVHGHKYYVHPNVNLYLDVSRSCPCDCEFCISKVKFDRLTINTDVYIQRLVDSFSLLKSVNPSIQVVGGEPTIYPGLYGIIDVIDNLMIRRPVLGTNGYLLDDDLVHRLNTSTFRHVNLSRCHYDDAKNQEIMRCKAGRNNDVLFHSIGERLKPKLRVQCNLIGGYIDTYGEIMQFIAYAHYVLKANNIAFAQLTPLPRDDYYQDSVIDYVSTRQVDIDAILEKISEDKMFRFIKYRGGVACYYEIWEYCGYSDPITVMFKFSDNFYLGRIDNMPGYIPDFVLHTDGTLCGSWNKNIKVLLPAVGEKDG
jgi:MoaA/NifB/PqqE/SkfB family radical SAM enzyme